MELDIGESTISNNSNIVPISNTTDTINKTTDVDNDTVLVNTNDNMTNAYSNTNTDNERVDTNSNIAGKKNKSHSYYDLQCDTDISDSESNDLSDIHMTLMSTALATTSETGDSDIELDNDNKRFVGTNDSVSNMHDNVQSDFVPVDVETSGSPSNSVTLLLIVI